MFIGRTFSAVIVLSATVATLVACKGQDTFTSNPVKNYDSVTNGGLRPYDTAQRQRDYDQKVADTAKPCGIPFVLSIEGERGKAATFKEEQEKTIVLHVDSQLDAGAKWDVKAVGAPCEKCSTFTQVSKSDKSAVYKFTWKPAKGASDSVDGNFLTLRYDWAIEARCSALPITEPITLFVRTNDNKPVVTVPGLPADTVKFGAPAVKIQILVVDPSVQSKDDAAPTITFGKKTTKGILPLKTAISCPDAGSQIETANGQIASSFDCTFDSSLFAKDPNFKSLSGSGKTVESVLAIQAKSGVSGATSITTSNLKVLFEKIPAAAVPTATATPKKAEGV